MVLMGSTRVLALSARGSGIAEAGAEATGAGAAAGTAVAALYVLAAWELPNASTSCLVIRPPAPVPFTFARSMLYSRAILRTSGDSGPRSSSPPDATGGAVVGGGGGACGAGAGWACTVAGGAGGGDATAAGCGGTDTPVPMRPTTVLMPTVAPSATRISVRTPASGAGISVSTLSVEISKSGSSRSTFSPTFFSHRVKVPSTMLSPIWGITTSAICSPSRILNFLMRQHQFVLKRSRKRGCDGVLHLVAARRATQAPQRTNRPVQSARNNVLKVA